MAIRRNGNAVNMTDVALKAGVSQSTVSRVLNNQPGISRHTRTTVLETLRQLGYKTSSGHAKPEAEETAAVSLVMCPLPEQNDPFALEYFATVASGIRETLEKVGARLRLQTLPAGAAELPGATTAEGVILLGFPSEELRAALRKQHIVYIIASGDIYSSTEDMVTVNNFEASVEACRYLLRRGIRRIGFLMAPFGLERYAGFQMELLRNSLNVRPEDFRLQPNTQLPTFIEAIHHWIAEKDLPEALVVSHIDAARAIKTMLLLNGFRIPEDIQLFAFDHHPGTCSEIISLHTDPYQLGRHAALRIQHKLRHPNEAPVHTVVPMVLTTPPESNSHVS